YLLLLFAHFPAPPPLPSFPTRRSSDLVSLIGSLGRSDLPPPNMTTAICYSVLGREHSNRAIVVMPEFGIWIHAQHRFFAGHLGSDRKSTRLNSSHRTISYAVFCLKKKT